ncbi:MAG: hypothetical protein PHF60_00375 [Candidatus ainarchaeum sp.]|nr:hypothetical protein [Candidatus ainarchaeum sp.]
MAAELEAILNEMKEKGIGGAIVSSDGVVIHSTIALNEPASSVIASVSNISDALMKKMGDQHKEIEISFGGLIVVLVPIKSHVFCGMVKDREEKKTVLEYAQKARAYL